VLKRKPWPKSVQRVFRKNGLPGDVPFEQIAETFTEAEFLELSGCGPKTLEAAKKALNTVGLKFSSRKVIPMPTAAADSMPTAAAAQPDPPEEEIEEIEVDLNEEEEEEKTDPERPAVMPPPTPADANIRVDVYRITSPKEEVGSYSHEVDSDFLSQFGAGTYKTMIHKFNPHSGKFELVNSPRITV
jgi:hypothetical protein